MGAFCCVCLFNLVVCFSLRCSSGSTTGITTLSCPNCSTRWASLCPAGSAKNWSTAGSGTAAGAHSSAHRTTAQLCRETPGLAWPRLLKIPNIFVKEVATWKEDLVKTADNSGQNHSPPRWTGSRRGWWGEQEDGCFQQLMVLVLPSPPGPPAGVIQDSRQEGKTLQTTAVFDTHYSSSSNLFTGIVSWKANCCHKFTQLGRGGGREMTRSTFITADSDRAAAFNGNECRQDDIDEMNDMQTQ